MSYQLFLEKLKTKIKAQRDEQVDYLAAGYGSQDYERRVGVIKGLDDALAHAHQVLRDLHGAEEQ